VERDRLMHGADLWNAPIFHPIQGAFAFSEPLLLPGAIAAPLFARHAPPALAHNFAFLIVLSLGGIVACRLAVVASNSFHKGFLGHRVKELEAGS
jgi:hypothetical protein